MTEQAIEDKETILLQEGEKIPGQGEGEDEAAAKAAEAQEQMEARARHLGWVPREEFRGDPEQWKSAEEFVRHGEETLPVLRENLRKLHGKLDDQGRIIKEFAEHHKKTEERALKKALKRLKEEQLEAVEDGDVKKYQEIDGEIEELEKTRAKAKPDTEEPPGDGKKNPAFVEWAKENPWYDDDIEMTVYANQAGGVIHAKNPGIPASELYAKVTEEVKRRFPERFKNARRSQASAVEGDRPGAEDTGQSGKSYADLPPEARRQCDEWVKEGLLTREQYVRDYEFD